MGYSVLLLRKEVKERNQGLDFLEKPESVLAFTSEQYERLKNLLIKYGYQIEGEQEGVITFNFQGGLDGIIVRLYPYQVAFSSGFSVEGIFEIAQTASKMVDGEIVKLDLQVGSWEE
jgi:hypothetical protein